MGDEAEGAAVLVRVLLLLLLILLLLLFPAYRVDTGIIIVLAEFVKMPDDDEFVRFLAATIVEMKI